MKRRPHSDVVLAGRRSGLADRLFAGRDFCAATLDVLTHGRALEGVAESRIPDDHHDDDHADDCAADAIQFYLPLTDDVTTILGRTIASSTGEIAPSDGPDAGNSAHFVAGSKFVNVDNGAGLSPGSSDFTLETYVKFTSVSSYVRFLGDWDNPGQMIDATVEGIIHLYLVPDGGNKIGRAHV